jgi:hypothetical protein
MLGGASKGFRAGATCLLALLLNCSLSAYSVLTHEALVDAMWDVELKALLLARFPNATPEELKKAHGFAYGGAIIQDMGFYPHGSAQFSDLTHYVRTGDFIVALINESQDLNELAFALGAMSHYMGDLDGHRLRRMLASPCCTRTCERSTATSSRTNKIQAHI